MPDGNARQRLSAREKLRDIRFLQVRRQPRIDAGNVAGHPVEKVGLGGAEQRIEDRLVDFRGAISRRKRWNIFLCTSRDLGTDARGMQIERGQESSPREIKAPRNLQRAPQAVDRLRRRQLRPLVEPFWHQQLGAGADRNAPALDLDLDPHEQLRRRVDRDRAEAERPREMHGTFEESDVSQLQARRHDRQSSAPCEKKCLRMRCTSSVKTGSAITSSERGRGSGTS